VLLLCSFNAAQSAHAAVPFKTVVQPALQTYCYRCHGSTVQEADLRLDLLNPDMVTGNDAESWHDILNKLNLGEMPPEKAKQLPVAVHRQVTQWITGELRRSAQHRRSTGGQVVLRRMTSYEYNNTMRDLLGVNLDFAANLPPDPPSAAGFKNNGASLSISPLHIELYLKAARRGLQHAIVTGDKPPVYRKKSDKTEAVRRLKGKTTSQLAYGDRFIFRTMEFPRQGEVLVRIRAGAGMTAGAAGGRDDKRGGITPDENPAPAAYPRLRIAMGVRADTRAPEATLAEVDITSSVEDPQLYEFRARIEDFPLPGKNPKYPGFQITAYHDPPPGAALIKKKKKQQKKAALPAAAAPYIKIESVEFEGPYLPQWPPASHTAILFPSPRQDDQPQYAREVITQFLARAHRRPPAPSSVETLMKYYRRIRPVEESFETTMREVLAMALVSPEFLYLVEPKRSNGPRKLSQYELASRLSYFLWSTMPDGTLFKLAAAGELHQPAVLKQQVARMLQSARSRQFVQHFTDQWLDLSAVDRVAVNPEFYPDFDERLKADMRRETQLFFAEILDGNSSCLQLLDARFAMLNRRLAIHYGVSNPPRGTAFERVALPADGRRGGLLTQGSFLLGNSNGEDSHPIKRAVWVLDRLLDSPPAPPPPDVPELDSSEPDFARLPLKQQLELHRKKESCNNCHRGIDPWGIAFEHFDAIGRYRSHTTTPKKRRRKTTLVNATAVLPGGVEINGVKGLQQHLLSARKQQFALAIVKRMLTYALGRSIELQDHETVERLARQFELDGFRLPVLITNIVLSQPFQTK